MIKLDLKGRFIRITNENEFEVLRVLEFLGYKWKSGKNPTEFLPLATKSASWGWLNGEDDILIDDENKTIYGSSNLIGYSEITLSNIRQMYRNKIGIFNDAISSIMDLHGLENGMGLRLDCVNVEDGQVLKVMMDVGDCKCVMVWMSGMRNLCLKKLQCMGFKFKYEEFDGFWRK